MFIKQVRMCGFKAFGASTVFGDFSPQKNCICGLNGSGKSTFYTAIEFVFLDEFSHLRPSDHQSLFFSGKSLYSTPTAFVEIVFDNSSKRLPLNDAEVSIRRSIGIHKDEYFVQRKHSTRQDILNLFETANFSIRSGQFSIRQGRVKAITEMNDVSRLELLYEISGIHYYDEQRKESIAMLAQAEIRREKIKNTISELEERLEQIAKEKQELEEYEEMNKIKRALEFLIYDQERTKIDEKLQEKESDIEKESSVVNGLQKEHDDALNKRNTLEEKMEQIEAKIKQSENYSEELEQIRENLVKKKTRSDCTLEILQDKMRTAEDNLKALHSQNISLNDQILDLQAKYDDCSAECELLNRTKIQVESKLFSIDAFKQTKEEIDSIDNEITEITGKIDASKENNHNDLNKLNEEYAQLNEEREKIENEKNKLIQLNKNHSLERIQKFDERKQLFKLQFETEKMKNVQELSYNKSVSDYEHLMGETLGIISYLREKYEDDPNYHGQLIDLINFDEDLDSAIDAVAGSVLFSVVVGNDELGAKILNDLQKHNLNGRISIYTLNQIKESKKSIQSTQNSEPLIGKIQFAEKFKKVVELVFGSIVLCSTISVAAEISSAMNVNCVTFAGETARASGMMSGGYITSQRSICKLKRRMLEKRSVFSKAEEDLANYQTQIDDIEAYIKSCENEISMEEDKISLFDRKSSSLASSISEKKEKINNIERELDVLYQQKSELERQKDVLCSKLKVLSQSENNPDQDIKLDMEDLKEISVKLATKNLALRQLNFDLIPLRQQLESNEKEINNMKEGRIEELREKTIKEKSAISASIEKYESEKVQIDSDKEQYLIEQENLKKVLASIRRVEKESEQLLTKEANTLEELNRSKILYQTKREEILKKIANIGPLPSDEIEDHKDKSHNEILNLLQSTNDQMQRFRFVNKKAIEQFRQFEKQGMDLKMRQEDIEKSIEPIKQLIARLDENKEKAISKTFATISDNFAKMYSKLNPSKQARLVLITQNDNFLTDETSSIKFKGISIKIDQKNFEELSGGEKTLVAIALILALQQADAGPFYLFDEIDSDLDPGARAALANLIDELATNEDTSKRTQFIFTTHRPELMNIADKFFVVKSQNDSSVVNETSLENALEIIEL